eukprot:GDKJ01060894.1.p1 GENE.GDKJ01060894.1~~GDKJ01060894.1.p1  ORF type:complete len:850 (+),score=180.75 GDKJ01060894.1:25-2550(+)
MKHFLCAYFLTNAVAFDADQLKSTMYSSSLDRGAVDAFIALQTFLHKSDDSNEASPQNHLSNSISLKVSSFDKSDLTSFFYDPEYFDGVTTLSIKKTSAATDASVLASAKGSEIPTLGVCLNPIIQNQIKNWKDNPVKNCLVPLSDKYSIDATVPTESDFWAAMLKTLEVSTSPIRAGLEFFKMFDKVSPATWSKIPLNEVEDLIETIKELAVGEKNKDKNVKLTSKKLLAISDPRRSKCILSLPAFVTMILDQRYHIQGKEAPDSEKLKQLDFAAEKYVEACRFYGREFLNLPLISRSFSTSDHFHPQHPSAVVKGVLDSNPHSLPYHASELHFMMYPYHSPDHGVLRIIPSGALLTENQAQFDPWISQSPEKLFNEVQKLNQAESRLPLYLDAHRAFEGTIEAPPVLHTSISVFVAKRLTDFHFPILLDSFNKYRKIRAPIKQLQSERDLLKHIVLHASGDVLRTLLLNHNPFSSSETVSQAVVQLLSDPSTETPCPSAKSIMSTLEERRILHRDIQMRVVQEAIVHYDKNSRAHRNLFTAFRQAASVIGADVVGRMVKSFLLSDVLDVDFLHEWESPLDPDHPAREKSLLKFPSNDGCEYNDKSTFKKEMINAFAPAIQKARDNLFVDVTLSEYWKRAGKYRMNAYLSRVQSGASSPNERLLRDLQLVSSLDCSFSASSSSSCVFALKDARMLIGRMLSRRFGEGRSIDQDFLAYLLKKLLIDAKEEVTVFEGKEMDKLLLTGWEGTNRTRRINQLKLNTLLSFLSDLASEMSKDKKNLCTLILVQCGDKPITIRAYLEELIEKYSDSKVVVTKDMMTFKQRDLKKVHEICQGFFFER